MIVISCIDLELTISCMELIVQCSVLQSGVIQSPGPVGRQTVPAATTPPPAPGLLRRNVVTSPEVIGSGVTGPGVTGPVVFCQTIPISSRFSRCLQQLRQQLDEFMCRVCIVCLFVVQRMDVASSIYSFR